MAGYSEKSLVDKLGIKAGHKLALLDAPEDFDWVLGPLPPSVEVRRDMGSPGELDVAVLFTTKRADLEKRFAKVAKTIQPAGALWVSWPKKTSGVKTDVTEDVVRAVAVAAGLVDVKVCAVDETWSGLKCVVRLKDRPRTPPRPK